MPAPFMIVFALYPRITQLDFTGPFEVLSRLPDARCVLASVEGGELEADKGLRFAGLVRLADVDECHLLCVPGGYGTVNAIEDPAYLSSVRRLGLRARFVTSVCTGSLLLAAAGLLHGKRATSHWAWRDLLREFGVMPDPARVVRDGNVITGAGAYSIASCTASA
jgi:cyclohexyl-isocyanide hydratase